ncbi:hypothetical protein [Methylomonas sp. HYX-M1]|uniref:phage tail terminator protein n=1 Tax=Methylomonas sp. HYX-M1 TaxID=3139307 RepID=UPI00345C24CB
MLTLEQNIVLRIQSQVSGFITVGNASLLAGLRDIGPLLPGCFVVPGGGEPVSPGNPTDTPLLEQQEWDVIIIVPHQATDSANGLTEVVASGFMSAVLKALHGWKADPTQRQGFIYQGRERPSYNLGYAEFPMTFLANAVIGMA